MRKSHFGEILKIFVIVSSEKTPSYIFHTYTGHVWNELKENEKMRKNHIGEILNILVIASSENSFQQFSHGFV
jgi:hypothetical protein